MESSEGLMEEAMNRIERIAKKVNKKPRILRVDRGRGNIPPPTRRHRDRKKEENKRKCRKFNWKGCED